MTTDIEEWQEPTDLETQLENEADLELDAVESTDDVSASNSSFQGKSKAKDLKERISFVRLLERDGVAVSGAGPWRKCLCPFHADNNPSFSVNEETNWGKCWSCDWKGDIYTYEMEKRNLGFSDALASLEKKEKYIKRTEPRKGTSGTPRPGGEYQLTPEQVKTRQQAAKRLAESIDLCTRVADPRKWSPKTIQKLAEEGVLGWDQGALAFLYETGMKLRNWPHRQFQWEFGKPSVWRRQRIASATEVVLCEGETDAISLIDKGIEDDPAFAVVALPSATTIPAGLVELLRGKHVTLCMDNDEAGEKALHKLNAMLEPVCASVSTINYGEEDSHE